VLTTAQYRKMYDSVSLYSIYTRRPTTWAYLGYWRRLHARTRRDHHSHRLPTDCATLYRLLFTLLCGQQYCLYEI